MGSAARETADDDITVTQFYFIVEEQDSWNHLGVVRRCVMLNAKGNLEVDQYMCTNVSHVFAAGDCVGGMQFMHLAGCQGSICSWNARMPSLLWQKGPVDVSVPRVTFTDPEIASVGLSVLDDAKGVYSDAMQTRVEMKHRDRAVCDGRGEVGFVLFVNRGMAGTLVGASVVGEGAGELLSELALAIKNKLSMTDIATTMHPYPSMAFGLQVATSSQMNKSLQNTVEEGYVISCFRKCFGPTLHGTGGRGEVAGTAGARTTRSTRRLQ
jgi:pyruvate/2-oxoglutarate dehydrogenase complex dihydrolipoamide dehydrogenase (E3) component